MKKRPTTAKRATKDLKIRKNGDVKGGTATILSNLQRKFSQTEDSVASNMK